MLSIFCKILRCDSHAKCLGTRLGNWQRWLWLFYIKLPQDRSYFEHRKLLNRSDLYERLRARTRSGEPPPTNTERRPASIDNWLTAEHNSHTPHACISHLSTHARLGKALAFLMLLIMSKSRTSFTAFIPARFGRQVLWVESYQALVVTIARTQTSHINLYWLGPSSEIWNHSIETKIIIASAWVWSVNFRLRAVRLASWRGRNTRTH